MTAGPGFFVWQVRPQDTKTLASLGHLLLTRNVTLDDEQADDTFKETMTHILPGAKEAAGGTKSSRISGVKLSKDALRATEISSVGVKS